MAHVDLRHALREHASTVRDRVMPSKKKAGKGQFTGKLARKTTKKSMSKTEQQRRLGDRIPAAGTSSATFDKRSRRLLSAVNVMCCVLC